MLEFSFTGSGTSGTVNPLQARSRIWLRPNGAGSAVGEVLIDSLYLANQSFVEDSCVDGEYVFTGDGTAVIYVTVTNWSKDNAEFVPSFGGYY